MPTNDDDRRPGRVTEGLVRWTGGGNEDHIADPNRPLAERFDLLRQGHPTQFCRRDRTALMVALEAIDRLSGRVEELEREAAETRALLARVVAAAERSVDLDVLAGHGIKLVGSRLAALEAKRGAGKEE